MISGRWEEPHGRLYALLVEVPLAHARSQSNNVSSTITRGICVGMRMEIAPHPVKMISEVVHDPTTGEKEILLGRIVLTTSPVQTIGVVL